MPIKVAYLHTVSSLVGLFNDLSKELLPVGTEVFHIADELLLKTVMALGGLSPFIYQRVAENVEPPPGLGGLARMRVEPQIHNFGGTGNPQRQGRGNLDLRAGVEAMRICQ